MGNDVSSLRTWFATHVSLDGKPYTLDADQAKAVFDSHKNTLVTARAGSGKTRVIVAKIAYLIASGQADFEEIAAFMFNRTAAAEVNERIGLVEIDGTPLKHWHGRKAPIKIASTFHKFALDMVKLSGEYPDIISEQTHDQLVRLAVRKVVAEQQRKLSAQTYTELLRLASSFIARAGQKYLGDKGLLALCADVDSYTQAHQADSTYDHNIYLHRVCLAAYQEYLLSLNFPQIDFNTLMSRAIRLLREAATQPTSTLHAQTARFKYIMVDEYQDFSYLFFSLVQAIRQNCPYAHLFAVGDDWQAINRFAGSDVDYFLNFAQYFPEDVVNIPLVTNYRSSRRIVENANDYMLKHYDPAAQRAVAFSKDRGKIKRLTYTKTNFDATDLREDALGDARFQLAISRVCGGQPAGYQAPAQLLKTVFKIVKKHRHDSLLLLHRHNFTSFPGVTLDGFHQSLRDIVLHERLLAPDAFDQRIRIMTMHKSKGLESDVVILLEADRSQVLSAHPHATIFELFGDTLAAEKADQERLLYVALTRAKRRLYILSSDDKSPV